MSTSFSLRAAALLFFAAAVLSAAPALPFTDRLLRDEAFWGDGRAEITVFEATENRYGVVRPAEVRHLLVRESFAAKERVKADDWRAAGTYPVIKLVQTLSVPVGSYRYDQGHSSFWRAGDGALIKFAHTTNDSCGLSYKQGDLQPGGGAGARSTWRYRAFTYWEGMSEVERRAAAPAGALFYDELPFRLRLLDWERAAARPEGFAVPVMASVIGSRADELVWREATVTVEQADEAWRVRVAQARGEDVFEFEVAPPHLLRRWARPDGSALVRRHATRLAYWEHNRPGDEVLVEPPAVVPSR